MGDEKMDKTIMIELSNTFKDAVSDVDVPSPNRAVARIDPGKVKDFYLTTVSTIFPVYQVWIILLIKWRWYIMSHHIRHRWS
jgi:hypothetical protein